MSLTAKLVISLACTCAVSGAEKVEGDYIDGEFLFLVDNTLTNATDAEITVSLENDFNLSVVEVDQFTTVRVIFVRGNEDDFDRAKNGVPGVTAGEQNRVVSVAGNKAVKIQEFPCSPCHKESATRAWGLDRVDQRDKLISDDPLNFEADYMVGPHRGAGVVAYVTDTGIDTSHPEFGGRAFCLHSTPDMGVPCVDDNSHGTHVAGTIGSRRYGVAKDVTLIGVKMFNRYGFGTTAGVCNGLQWVLTHHNSRWNFPFIAKSVVNMSWGFFSVNNIIMAAVNQLLNAGATAVVAAHNLNIDACNMSPGNVPGAITVGATDVEDESASFTNWGRCVDVFAPGVRVMSTMPGNGFGVKSGTSMSAPHVTGAVAIEMGKRILPSSPAQMHSFIVSGASKNKIAFSTANHAKSPNLLLHVPCCDISKRQAKRIGRN